jgi:tetrapyrrole methylase family protein/MazG family protein
MDFYELVRLMATLRSPDGCPWDRAQTTADLRPYIMEEALELVEAVDSGDNGAIREELGDLLFEIIFVARVKEEEGAFSIDDVIGGIGKKMIERHPHVFGGDRLSSPAEVEKSWDEIKAKKRDDDSILSGITEDLPGLVIAQKYGERASDVGFDWDNADGVIKKIEEELAELTDAIRNGDAGGIEQEVGDVLFSAANLARFLKVNAELALRKANRKFSKRFSYVEDAVRKRGGTLKGMTMDELERLWEEAKSAVGNRP